MGTINPTIESNGTYLVLIADGLDRGGSIDSSSPHGGVSRHCLGCAVTGYLVEVEKVSRDQTGRMEKALPRGIRKRL